MASQIPDKTISVFARSIVQEARNYGFSQIDTVRLINALMDLSVEDSGVYRRQEPARSRAEVITSIDDPELDVRTFPLTARHLKIRAANLKSDPPILESWLKEKRGQHFLLSCATAQQTDPASLIANPDNHIGIVTIGEDRPIGAVAFLDHDKAQRRAELRKLIGVPEERGKGYAEEATVLWLKYGIERLGLEKIYLSTLQNHLRNIQLNESIGFRVEGVLADEVLIDGQRMDVLRMGFCRCRGTPS